MGPQISFSFGKRMDNSRFFPPAPHTISVGCCKNAIFTFNPCTPPHGFHRASRYTGEALRELTWTGASLWHLRELAGGAFGAERLPPLCMSSKAGHS